MRPIDEGPIAIAGAGSVGCYVGGALALAGRRVRLLGRTRVANEIAEHGLRVTNFDGLDHHFPPESMPISTDPAATLADARIVLVTVKSGATEEMGRIIAETPLKKRSSVSYQNCVATQTFCAKLRAAGPCSTAWCLSMYCRWARDAFTVHRWQRQDQRRRFRARNLPDGPRRHRRVRVRHASGPYGANCWSI